MIRTKPRKVLKKKASQSVYRVTLISKHNNIHQDTGALDSIPHLCHTLWYQLAYYLQFDIPPNMHIQLYLQA